MARGRDHGAFKEAVRILEHDIIFGVVLPRQRLVEDDIIERFGTTRHRARLILDDLVKKGLVLHIPKKGAVVRDFSTKEARELYEMRALLQGAAIAKIALPFSAATVQALEVIHAEHIAAGQADDLVGLFEANNRFHARIFAEAGDTTLQEAIEDYARRTHPIRSQGFMDEIYLAEAQADHATLIAAGHEGDREEMVKIDRAHMMRPLERYLAAKQVTERLSG